MVNLDVVAKLPNERAAAFVVQITAPHIQCLNARWRRRFNRLTIAIANNEIIADDPLERRKWKHMRNQWRAHLILDVEDEPCITCSYDKTVGSNIKVDEFKVVSVQEIVDCHLTFTFNPWVSIARD